MGSIQDILEIKALNAPAQIVRIPNQLDVPLTPRIVKLVDSPQFQRLKNISQLGVVSTVYPAAVHNRFEHSLGVYRMALLFLRQLSASSRFTELVDTPSATALIVAALLHDIGHWPFCHPIEDLNQENVPSHESLGANHIRNGSIATTIREEFMVDPEQVVRLVKREPANDVELLLCSILSGPIDVDKMDYLYRDSLHSGVPYGQNFDSQRLVSSLCLNQDSNRLAITHKGRTAAELMVFARYVMFSEVYWHHAVRAATAMLQRAVFLWLQDHGPELLMQTAEFGDRHWVDCWINATEGSDGGELFEKLFGRRRILYKRLASFSSQENPAVFEQVAHKPYGWLSQCSDKLAELLTEKSQNKISSNQILIDAPPEGLEVQFNVDVAYDEEVYRRLGDVSPVVQTLADRQFDDLVKQVRVFCDPDIRSSLSSIDLSMLLTRAVEQTNRNFSI